MGCRGMGRAAHLLTSALPMQFRHLPVPFHQRQEELKFTTALGRLQHRVRETRLLRETLQQGTKAGQGGIQGLDSRGVWGGLRSDLFLDLCLA